MTQRDDGGPAFPRYNIRGGIAMSEGMSLQDWFAGQVLVGEMIQGGNVLPPGMAKHCYDMADAMLAERNRRNSE